MAEAMEIVLRKMAVYGCMYFNAFDPAVGMRTIKPSIALIY